MNRALIVFTLLIVAMSWAEASSPRKLEAVAAEQEFIGDLKVQRVKKAGMECLVIKGGEICSKQPFAKKLQNYDGEVKTSPATASSPALIPPSPEGGKKDKKLSAAECRRQAPFRIAPHPHDSAVVDKLCADEERADHALDSFELGIRAGMHTHHALELALSSPNPAAAAACYQQKLGREAPTNDLAFQKCKNS